MVRRLITRMVRWSTRFPPVVLIVIGTALCLYYIGAATMGGTVLWLSPRTVLLDPTPGTTQTRQIFIFNPTSSFIYIDAAPHCGCTRMKLSENGLYPLTGCFLTITIDVDQTTGRKLKDIATINANIGSHKWTEDVRLALKNEQGHA